jgi:hypothetical protein
LQRLGNEAGHISPANLFQQSADFFGIKLAHLALFLCAMPVLIRELVPASVDIRGWGLDFFVLSINYS